MKGAKEAKTKKEEAQKKAGVRPVSAHQGNGQQKNGGQRNGRHGNGHEAAPESVARKHNGGGPLSREAGYRIRTRLIHGRSKTPRWDFSHHVVPPISSSATYRLSSAQRGAQGFFDFSVDAVQTKKRLPIYIYERLDEPTHGMLEDNLALAEEGEVAVTFATGMAAITATICVLAKAGDEVVAHDTLYGCTYSFMTNWLPRQGVTAKFVNLRDLEALENAITPQTRVVYLETPVNPNLELIDMGAVHAVVAYHNRRRSEAHQIKIVADNTFGTPYCQRPLTHGADVVVESLTKAIGGFGTDMGGAVVGPQKLHAALMLYRKDFGGVLNSKAAWAFLVYGLPSLPARMANMQRTAMRVAEFLEHHPKVASVAYPGLASFPQRELAEQQMVDYRGKFAPGSMIYFTLKDKPGRNDAAERFINYVADNSYTVTLAVSLGQIKTLIENPYSMTHSAYHLARGKKGANGHRDDGRGVQPGGIRLSIGLEDRHDIIADLETALARA